MKLVKWWLMLVVCASSSQALALCSTGDLFGEWHFVGSGADGEGVVCTLVFNAVGRLKSATSCEFFNDSSPDRIQFALDPTSQLSVNGRCGVSGSIGAVGDSPLGTFEGQMSRGGEYMQGTLEQNQPEDMGSEVFTAVKIK